jgi:Yip1 domain
METLPPVTPVIPIAPEAPVSSLKWYEIWRDVWTNPGVETFWSILKDRDHSATRGLIWIGVTSFVLGLISSIVSIPLLNRVSSQVPSFLSSGETIISALCTIILAPIFGIIGFIIMTGIYHLVAKLFGGNGTWNDLVFCLAAVIAPASIISTVVSAIYSIFSQVQALLFLFAIFAGIIALALFIYNIVLYILAIRAAENVGTGGAIGTVLLPIGVILVLSICCSALLIPAFINSVR